MLVLTTTNLFSTSVMFSFQMLCKWNNTVWELWGFTFSLNGILWTFIQLDVCANCFSPRGKVSFLSPCLWDFSSLVLSSLSMMCLDIDFFRFILFGIRTTPWVCRATCFTKLRKFLAVIPLSIFFFFSPNLFLLFWDSNDTNDHFCYSLISLRLFSYFHIHPHTHTHTRPGKYFNF